MTAVALLLFSVAGAALVLLALQWLFRYSKLIKTFSAIPCPPWLPLIGNAHILKSGGVEFLEQTASFAKKYGQSGVYVIWLGTIPGVIVHRADHLEQLLSSTKHIDKSFSYDLVHPWLGTGLLTSTGEKWKSRRKLITPTFHFQILNDFREVICEHADVLVSQLDRMADTNEPFCVSPFLTNCALDIICETAMGERVEAQVHHDSEYIKAVYRMSEIVMLRSRTPWQWWDPLFNLMPAGKEHARSLRILHGFTDSVIQKRLAEMKQTSSSQADKGETKKRLAFLDLLLNESVEMGGTLGRMGIREEVDTFMFEGHDTTAAASNWLLYLIGAHPDVQMKLHEELDLIFRDSDRHPTMDDLKEMTYMECVIKETLRLYPSVPIFARSTTEPCTIAGCEIPTGTAVTVFCYVLHRDETYFPEPDKFDPDRFLQDEAANRHPFAYIPFSAGPRNCIGQKFAMMELKTELSALLRRFRVVSTQSRAEVRPCSDVVLRPEKGITIKIFRR